MTLNLWTFGNVYMVRFCTLNPKPSEMGQALLEGNPCISMHDLIFTHFVNLARPPSTYTLMTPQDKARNLYQTAIASLNSSLPLYVGFEGYAFNETADYNIVLVSACCYPQVRASRRLMNLDNMWTAC